MTGSNIFLPRCVSARVPPYLHTSVTWALPVSKDVSEGALRCADARALILRSSDSLRMRSKVRETEQDKLATIERQREQCLSVLENMRAASRQAHTALSGECAIVRLRGRAIRAKGHDEGGRRTRNMLRLP